MGREVDDLRDQVDRAAASRLARRFDRVLRHPRGLGLPRRLGADRRRASAWPGCSTSAICWSSRRCARACSTTSTRRRSPGWCRCFTYEHRSPEPPPAPWFPSATVRKRWPAIEALASELERRRGGGRPAAHPAARPDVRRRRLRLGGRGGLRRGGRGRGAVRRRLRAQHQAADRPAPPARPTSPRRRTTAGHGARRPPTRCSAAWSRRRRSRRGRRRPTRRTRDDRAGRAVGRLPGALPAGGVVVTTDAEARAVVEPARRAGEPLPPLGLLGGDLCRTVGGTRRRGARLAAADAMRAAGRPRLGAARRPPALVRRPPRGPPLVVAGPRRRRHERPVRRGAGTSPPAAIPNDGRLDVVDVDAVDVGSPSAWQGPAAPADRHPPAPPGHHRAARRRPSRRRSTRRCGCGSTASAMGEVRNLAVRVEPDALTASSCEGRRARAERARRPCRADPSRVYGRRPWTPGSSTSRPGHLPHGPTIDRRPGRRPRRGAVRVVASALNHMDLWVTRGLPKPPLPARARLRRRRRGRRGRRRGDRRRRRRRGRDQPGGVAGRGDRRPRQRQPDGRRLHDLRRALLGRPRAPTPWRRPGTSSPRPAGRTLGGVRRLPAGLPHRVPHAPPGPAAGRATRCSSSASAAGVSCAALALGRRMGAEVVATSRSEAKREQALAMGADGGVRLGRPTLAGARPTSWWRASARRRGSSRCGRSRPADGSWCAAARRGRRWS